MGNYHYGLRKPNEYPIYFKTKEERDKAIARSKKGAWVLNGNFIIPHVGENIRYDKVVTTTSVTNPKRLEYRYYHKGKLIKVLRRD
jgi:hypothetical protein